MPVHSQKRHAHHRANPAVNDALARIETAVGGGVGRQDRPPRLHHAVDQGKTQPKGPPLGAASDLPGPQQEPSRRGIAQQHEAPLGAGKHLEQSVEQPWQHLVEGERGADGPVEPDDSTQFGLRVLPDLHIARRLTDGQLRDDDGIVISPLDDLVEERGLRPENRARTRRLIRPRRAVAGDKHQQLFADLNLVAFRKTVRCGKRPAVVEGAVATAKVFDGRVAVVDRDGRVLAAHGRGINHDIAGRMTANDDSALAERHAFATAGSGFQLKKRHGLLALVHSPREAALGIASPKPAE